MRQTTFTTQLRVLLCEHCGAPLTAPLGGGSIPCGYCRVVNVLVTRDDHASFVPPRAPISEPERLARLRMQDGRPLSPPQSLLYLLRGNTFDPTKVQEGFLVFQATRKEVKATHSSDAAERLYFLTLIASDYLAQQGDEARRRALLETALESLTLPRHKQVIRCMLSSAAAREGDLAAAETWLAPCDPRSDDLDSDSAWRIARAYLDTCRRDYRAVLAVLGASENEIPISDARDPMATALRANALERLGDVPRAVNVLRARMMSESAAGRLAIEEFVRTNAALQLCPQSLPAATQAHVAQAARDIAASSGGGAGLVVMAIGGLGLAAAVVLGVMGLVSAFRHPLGGTTASLGSTLVELAALVIWPGLAGLILLPLGYSMFRKGQEAGYIRQHGIPATGTVQHITSTGVKVNNVPQVKLDILVELDGRPPYVASVERLGNPYFPGAQVPLRVHPEKPHAIIIETM